MPFYPMKSKFKSLFFLKSEILFLMIIFGYSISYIINVLLAHWLGAEIYGDYAVAINVAYLCASIALLGGDGSAIKHLPLYIEKNSWPHIKGFIFLHLRLIFFISVIIILLSTLAIFSYHIFSKNEHVWHKLHPVVYAIWLVPLIAYFVFLGRVIRGIGKSFISMLPKNILLPIFFIIILLLMLYSIKKINIIAATISFGLTVILLILYELIIIHMTLKKNLYQHTAAYQKKQWRKVGLTFLGVNLSTVILMRIDIIMLEVLSSNEIQVGIFSAILQVAGFLWLANYTISSFISTPISKLQHLGDKSTLQKYFKIANLSILISTTAMVIFFLIFAKNILRLFGPEFMVGIIPYLITIIGVYIYTCISLAMTFLEYAGQEVLTAKIVFYTLLYLIIANIILIPCFDIYGAVISLISSRLLQYGISIYFVKKRLKLNFFSSMS